MKTEFKSSSTIKTGTLSVSNINTDLNSTSNINAEFNSSSTLNATSNDINTNHLKVIIDNETGRYIEADTESRPDYVILKLFSAKGTLLDTTEFNVSGAASSTIISARLENNKIILVKSVGPDIVCDITALFNLIDTKVDKDGDKVLSTNDYTNTEKYKVQTGYTHSQSAHAPIDAQKNIQSDWSQLDSTKDDFIKNKPNLAQVAISGNYNDLTNKPNLFSGNYNDLSNKPNLFSGKYDDLTGKPNIPDAYTKNEIDAVLNIKQDKIDENNKLPYSSISGTPTDLSQFNNNTGFITKDVNNLANYYNKNDSDDKYVVKVSGKQLSTEDFTTDLKNKLNSLYADNYIKNVSIDNDTFVITFTKRDNTTTTIDLPLESVVVNAEYNNTTHNLTLTLQNGTNVEIPIGGIVDGLLALPSEDKGETSNKTLLFGDTFKVVFIGADGTIAEKVMTLPTPDVDKNYVDIELAKKQNKIDSDNKLPYSMISDTPTIPTDTNQLVNSAGFITADDIPTIPEKTSELINDTGFITASDIPELKTINNQEIIGDGNINVQEPLIDVGVNANIKTINNQSILGSGNIIIQEPDVDKDYVDTELSKKQNKIDIDNKLDYSLIGNTPIIPIVPTNVSAFNNDAGYITNNDIPNIPSDLGDLTNNAGYIKSEDIPQNLSDFTNDVGFITDESLPTNVSDLVNDLGYITENDLPAIPNKTSDLLNDSGFITQTDIPNIPSKTSDLTNDSGFITKDISDLTNYTTTNELQNALNNKVDKIPGYDLSKNDYSDAEKNKVQTAYNHSQLPHNYEPANINIQEHILNKNNPHNITKTQLDLGNVDNVKQATKTEFDNYVNSNSLVLNNKVPKERKIIGINLEDNITLSEFKTALGNATTSVAGLMSAVDKSRLNTLFALLDESEENDIVDNINEILAIFENYPEGAELLEILSNKVDKESGKQLSTNDYDNDEKQKVNDAYLHSQRNHAPADAQKNVQADWDQTDENADDYIKNKPTALAVPDITITNGAGEAGKYISQIEIDTLDNHKLNITKELLPQGFSGDYNDLINTPSIPEISTDIAQDATSDIKTASPKAVKDYVDTAINPISDNPEFESITVNEEWKITSDVDKFQIQQKVSNAFVDIIQIYVTQDSTSPNAKVKINAKTEIADLDFGGW